MPIIGPSVMLAFLMTLTPRGGHQKNDPDAIVRSFHEALSSGNREAALAALDPAVVIFEQGGAEMSREEYISHHLADDIEFAQATSWKVLDQRSGAAGKGAWVLTTSETSGTFKGRSIASRGVETMVLKDTPSGWRIVHIHWSSRPQQERKP